MSWTKYLRACLLVLISTIAAIIFVEGALRLYKSLDKMSVVDEGNILRNFDFNYNISDLYSSNLKVVHYKRNKFGLRDRCIDNSKIDILTIGGSTTDQRYVPLEATWQSVLENSLKEVNTEFGCVTNAGVDGHSTHGHLFSFKHWLPLIPQLNPDYVILYVGINDANFLLNKKPLPGFDDNNWPGFKGFLKRFEIVQELLPLFHILKYGYKKSTFAYSGHNPRKFVQDDYTIKHLNKATVDLASANTHAFKLRMSTIIEYVKKLDAIPICVTQPHRFTINNGQISLGIPDVMAPEFSGLDYDYSLHQINLALHELCGDFIIDLYNHTFKNEHFYDGVYTTDLGSIEIGKEIGLFFRKKFLIRNND